MAVQEREIDWSGKAQAANGVWPLLDLSERDGELGELSREVSRALDDLAQITSEFSCGSARSSVAVSVISDRVKVLRNELREVTSRAGSLRTSSEEAAASARVSAELAGKLAQECLRDVRARLARVDFLHG